MQSTDPHSCRPATRAAGFSAGANAPKPWVLVLAGVCDLEGTPQKVRCQKRVSGVIFFLKKIGGNPPFSKFSVTFPNLNDTLYRRTSSEFFLVKEHNMQSSCDLVRAASDGDPTKRHAAFECLVRQFQVLAYGCAYGIWVIFISLRTLHRMRSLPRTPSSENWKLPRRFPDGLNEL